MQLSHNLISRLRLAVAAALLGVVGASCSQIDEPDRKIKVEGVVLRPALIEDYTGQKCVNCPNAHEVIEKLEEQYGDSIIAVSIHAGGLALEVEKTKFSTGMIGLKTKQGQELNDRLNIIAWPRGCVNGGEVTREDLWAANVLKSLSTTPSLYASASAVMQPDSTINVKAMLSPRFDFKGTIHFWVTESNIVAIQLTETGTVKDYVHNNVFREAIGDIDGQSIELTKEVGKSVEASTKLRYNNYERWNADNISVVVIVRNQDGTVAQCTRTKLKH